MRSLLKKPGLACIEQNYHPVSNLKFISKILERCMLQHINRHCENLISSARISVTLQNQPQLSDITIENSQWSPVGEGKTLCYSHCSFGSQCCFWHCRCTQDQVWYKQFSTGLVFNLLEVDIFKVRIGDKCSSDKKLTSILLGSCASAEVVIIRCSTISTLPKWVCWWSFHTKCVLCKW